MFRRKKEKKKTSKLGSLGSKHVYQSERNPGKQGTTGLLRGRRVNILGHMELQANLGYESELEILVRSISIVLRVLTHDARSRPNYTFYILIDTSIQRVLCVYIFRS